MLNETSDFLSCNDATLVRGLLLDKVFSQLLAALEGTFLGRAAEQAESEQGSRFEMVVDKTVRLASLFPKVARQSHLVLNGSPNEYVEVSIDEPRNTRISSSSFVADLVLVCRLWKT